MTGVLSLECILPISSLPDWGPSWWTHALWWAACEDACMYIRFSPPVISYHCLRLRQPASSPATSQPTSISLLLGQRLSRGYFFCFSHLLSFILFSVSSVLSILLPLSFSQPSFCPLICLTSYLLPFVFLSHFHLPRLFSISHSPESTEVEEGHVALMPNYLFISNSLKNLK